MTALENALRKHFTEIYRALDELDALKQHSAAAQDELAKALLEVDKVGSLLLDVQEESNEHRQRADRFEKLLVEHKKTAEDEGSLEGDLGASRRKERKPLKSLNKINLN